MNLPEIKRIGDVFLLFWQTEGIKVSVDHIFEDVRGVVAELALSQNTRGENQHIYNAKINLLSPTAKEHLAKVLARYGQRDWQSMIEQLSVLTMRKYREGEPVIQVGNLPQREKPKYFLFPYLLEGAITTIFGYGESGKSYLATLLAVLVQNGISSLGLNPRMKGNVLYLDWEASAYMVDERVKALVAGLEIKIPQYPFYKRCSQPFAQSITEIQKEVLNKNIQVVIIDSVGMALSAKGDYHTSALELMRAARSLGTPVLCIDHKPKGEDKIFGSIYKENETRSAFEIIATHTAGEPILEMAVHHRKVNDAMRTKPRGFRFEFSGEDIPEKVMVTTLDLTKVRELVKTLPLKDQIVSVLREGKQSAADLAIELGHDNDRSIYTTLYRYKDTFQKCGKEWGLLS